jgi:hypothetical protein
MRLYAALLAAAMVVCGLAALVWWRPAEPLRFTTELGEGRAGAWLATDTSAELPLTFSEGTRVVMAPDSRGRVEELRPLGASFLLERGEVHARVVHERNANWRFLAGPFEVKVTGTSFAIQWDPGRERFAVQVDEGSVVVAGPHIGGVETVVAGKRCTVDLPSRTMRISPSDEGAHEGVDASPAPPGHETGLPAPSAAASPGSPLLPPTVANIPWTTLEEKGDYDAAYAAALGAGLGVVLRASSADELLRLAQVARLAGHRDTERQALVTCRRRFPGTERAAVAAYELGRSSSPSEASSWFDTYLGEQPAGPLAREASGRLIEARANAGDDRGAREAATRYLARYPDGPHATLARRVLAGSP